MNKSKLKLASVKLVNGGMKGVKLEYIDPSVKENVQFLDTYKAERKAPIHTELEDLFRSLRDPLLDICSYTATTPERDYLIEALEVTGIKYGEKGIVLYGNLSILGGNKELPLTTPLISGQEDYPDFADLEETAKKIYSETMEYMAGKKVMSDVQIVARFNSKNKDFDMAAFSNMSKEDQRDWATRILEEKHGCIVIHNDEFTTEDETPVLEQPEETAPSPQLLFQEEEIIVHEPLIIEEEDPLASIRAVKEMITAEEPTSVMTLIENEDFELPPAKKTEKKASTAKKIA